MTQKPLSNYDDIDSIICKGGLWDFIPLRYSLPASAAEFGTAAANHTALEATQRDAATSGLARISSSPDASMSRARSGFEHHYRVIWDSGGIDTDDVRLTTRQCRSA